MKKTVAILCGGGPAPGINTVVSSVAKVFLKHDYRVIGLHYGYKTLFTNKPEIEEISFAMADRIRNQGGSSLIMSRYKPKNEEFRSDFFIHNNVKLLVTIGGDDTASTANRISKYLMENNISIQNIHVPKTIDNDLPLPKDQPTFGYQSAKSEGVRIASTVYEDARTSGNWFVVSAMGREAGHLAFGIGAACHYPMIIIPEMFNQTKVSFNKITNLVISSMIKRKILGINYGAAIISEGVFHFMTDTEIQSTGITFTYDDHGHPELGNVSKAHIFNLLVQRKLKETGLSIKSRPVELGYELRCVTPTAFDLMYCSILGTGVKELYDRGLTGCMVTTNHEMAIQPLYLKDVEDENGKIRPRLLNVESEKSKLVFNNNLHYLTESDYDQASRYVGNPEEFDFYKLLNW
ncbi:MAG: 6-phosphofructokinase [Bacteroidales bacterium]|nr:6-phosphofructokinase [Bacteroidales bacterium]MDD2322576.1 6-phosphofructokinase [Bacteroidales bacterium]MDD3010952.1 6-phosphofructokinase [Bacteroidales bacterium]MDD3960707.1 6-phosphofructokinase [Bacteroidales bacterium]MDY0286588.1 6-phosphofructokinase [Bacteroidales bacterium]